MIGSAAWRRVGSVAAPALSAYANDVADKAGGDTITLSGTDLTGVTSATWGGTACTGVSSTATSVTMTLPAKASGTHAIQVTTGGGSSNTVNIEAWSPVDETLSVLLRSDYSGSPWVGKASAGTSLNRDATEATNPPTSTALYGKLAADFDGSNDKMLIDDTIGDAFGAASYSGVALVYIDAIGTDSATKGSNDPIITATSSGWFAVYLRSSGGGTLHFYHTDTGGTERLCQAASAVGTASPRLLHWKYDGTNLSVGFNGTWGTAVAGSALHASSQAHTLSMGQSINVDAWSDVKILEMACAKAVLSDTVITKWRKYANNKYGWSV